MIGLQSFVIAACLICCTLPAWGDGPGQSWDQLDREDQRLLMPFRGQWGGLSPERRDQLRQGVERWRRMTPQEQNAAQERYRKWSNLSPQERNTILRRSEEFRRLPFAEQQRIRERYQWYKSLPQQQRNMLRNRWQRMPQQQRPGPQYRMMRPSPPGGGQFRQGPRNGMGGRMGR